VFALFCVFDVIAAWAHFYTNLHTLIFLAAFLTLACMLYGFRRFFAMLPALGYIVMGLPIWNRLIDDNTNQLQIWSTTGAYGLLKVTGFNPLRMAPTEIQLDNMPLSIAAACSGMKLTLAMIASIVFIMLIARLKWWGNLIMIAIAFPLALAINSLRIALIGMFGETMGKDAGFWMHDYGSYGTLILAFWIVYVVAKKLGWNV
jgi:exosortase